MTPAVLAEMDEIGIRSVYDLASALLLDPQGVRELTANTESHVDDVPAVEYESGRILDRDASWLANFVLLAQHMTPLSRAFGGHVDALQLSRAEEIRDLRIREHINQLVAALERRLLPAKI
jgi:hypothetical protein